MPLRDRHCQVCDRVDRVWISSAATHSAYVCEGCDQ